MPSLRACQLADAISSVYVLVGLACGVVFGLLLSPKTTVGVLHWPCCTPQPGGQCGARRLQETAQAESFFDALFRAVPLRGEGTSAEETVPEWQWYDWVHPTFMAVTTLYTMVHCMLSSRNGALAVTALFLGLLSSVGSSIALVLIRATPERDDCCLCTVRALIDRPAVRADLEFWLGTLFVTLAPLISLVHHLSNTAERQSARVAAIQDVGGARGAPPNAPHCYCLYCGMLGYRLVRWARLPAERVLC